MGKKNKKKQRKKSGKHFQSEHSVNQLSSDSAQRDADLIEAKKIMSEVNAHTQAAIKFSEPLKIMPVAEKEDLSPARKPIGKWRSKMMDISGRLALYLTPLRLAFYIASGIMLFLVAVYTCVWAIWGRDLPDVRQLKALNFAETTTIYDRNGGVLYRIFGEENRRYVPLQQINKKVVDATISIEDKNFYGHFGFDPIGIIRAQINNLDEDNTLQGASTITQQLARNLYLSPERSMDRKIKELILAVQIEWNYSKDEILEMYFNKIPYGSNAFGIEAAAKTFFGKTSAEMNLLEASVLASLPKATSLYSPYSHRKELMGYCQVEQCSSPEDSNYIWGRKDYVLHRMLEDGKINKEDVLQAWRDGFGLQFQESKHRIKSEHFVFYVKDYLEKKYGQEMVASGGLEVMTTLDPLLQDYAEKLIAEKYESNVKRYGANNAALVSLDPHTGGILAMVGSVNYWNPDIDGQVNIATSLRQPGSTFKPLVYANAIENAGIGSGTVLGDYKTKFGDNYMPNNSDNEFKGKMTVRSALAQSRNIPAIKAWYVGGEENKLLDFLDKVGVRSLREFKDKYNSIPDRKWDFSYGPAMAIGSGEVRLLDLAGAYASFANGGRFNPVNPILEVRDRNGNVLEKYEDRGVQAMRPETAFIINSILSDIAARPIGSWRNVLTIDGQNLAAKTGTSNKKVGKASYPNNLLTIGYTPTILSATWVGNSDGRQTAARAWGEFTAAPINKAFLEFALKDKPLVEYERPAGVIAVGKEFYPPNWDKKKNYDAPFKPVDRKDCTPQEREKDPGLCKTKEEQEASDRAKEAAAAPEKPLNTGGFNR